MSRKSNLAQTTILLLLTLASANLSRGQDQLVLASGDYDGDGCTDLAIFRSSVGLWAIKGVSKFYYGTPGDIPASGDYDGDGCTDVTVFRAGRGLWAIRSVTRTYFGASSDISVPSDYNGDGITDIAVFRKSAGLWAIKGITRVYFGTSNDLPAPADYDGDGSADIAIFRSSTGLWVQKNITRFYYGTNGDLPVPADYRAAGTDDAAVFRPSSGLWAIKNFSRFYFGSSTDWAVPGRYTGNLNLPAIFKSSRGLWVIRGITRCYFGKRGDLPAAGSGRRKYNVPLGEVRTWAYNIQNVNTQAQRDELVGTHFDMYVLEPVVTEKGMENFDIASLVRDIRNYNITHYHKDPIILAYVDIGQAENWRWYWQSGWGVGNPEWIVADDPDEWEGCYPVAYWYDDWKDIVIYGSGGKSQVEVTLQAGFDGIYMDWVEAFSDDNVKAKAASEGKDPAIAMFDFIEEIRTYARRRSPHANPDYLIIAQNASDLYREDPSRYLQLIDAIACEAIWYDGDGGFDDWNDPRGYNVPTNDLYPGWTEEVLGYLQPMKGKLPIFCAEYAQNNGVNRATEVYSNLAPSHGFIPYCTRRSLARLSKKPYPPEYWPHDY